MMLNKYKKLRIFLIILLNFLLLNNSNAMDRNNMNNQKVAGQDLQEAVFAMGCFWCAESEFRDHKTNQVLMGIEDIKVGYAGGTKPDPTYQAHDGYKEAIKIQFNPSIISYQELLDIFWHNVDLFDGEGQFCDKGDAYKSVIYYKNDEQLDVVNNTKDELAKKFNKDIKTEIIEFTNFYDAEDEHQNYSNKNPVKYKYYRWSCGRDARLKEIWSQK